MYDIKLTNITHIKINKLTINGKSVNLYELNRKSKVARQNGFTYNPINKLTTKFCSHLRNINIS